MSAMKEATEVQKVQMQQVKIDDVEELYENMADMMADQEEINEMMSRDFGVDEIDEDEMMDELNELHEEMIIDEMNGVKEKP